MLVTIEDLRVKLHHVKIKFQAYCSACLFAFCHVGLSCVVEKLTLVLFQNKIIKPVQTFR